MGFLSSLAGLVPLFTATHRYKRWAIIGRPYGTSGDRSFRGGSGSKSCVNISTSIQHPALTLTLSRQGEGTASNVPTQLAGFSRPHCAGIIRPHDHTPTRGSRTPVHVAEDSPERERIPPTSNFVLITPEPRQETAFRDLDLNLDRFPDFSHPWLHGEGTASSVFRCSSDSRGITAVVSFAAGTALRLGVPVLRPRGRKLSLSRQGENSPKPDFVLLAPESKSAQPVDNQCRHFWLHGEGWGEGGRSPHKPDKCELPHMTINMFDSSKYPAPLRRPTQSIPRLIRVFPPYSASSFLTL